MGFKKFSYLWIGHRNDLIDQGVEKLLTREYGEALVLFTTAAELDPNNTTVQTNIQRLNQLGFHLDKEAS